MREEAETKVTDGNNTKESKRIDLRKTLISQITDKAKTDRRIITCKEA